MSKHKPDYCNHHESQTQTTPETCPACGALPCDWVNDPAWSIVRENALMRSFLERAMAHGLNGNRYYHALEAGDLGNEIKRFLEDHP